jgi:chromosome partitioning protein
MLAYTVYNQSGGQGKTTLTRDLAAAHAEAGHNVLLIDMDAQNGSLSNYLGVDDDKRNSDADDLTLHLVERGKGPFENLVESAAPQIDIIPSHKRLNNLTDILDTAAEMHSYENSGDEYPRFEQLLRVVRENSLTDTYDVLIIDPNAKADTAYYMSLYATRNVVIPALPTRTGYESIEGVTDSAQGIARELDINIGRLGVVPLMVDMRKSDHEDYGLKLHDEYDAPVYFKSLSAFESAEEEYVSIFTYLKEHRSRIRSSEINILPKYRTLLATICNTLNQPLSPNTWDNEQIFTGNDFWGDIDVPFSDSRASHHTRSSVEVK